MIEIRNVPATVGDKTVLQIVHADVTKGASIPHPGLALSIDPHDTPVSIHVGKLDAEGKFVENLP